MVATKYVNCHGLNSSNALERRWLPPSMLTVNCHGLNSYNALERRWLPPSMLTVMNSIAIMPWKGDGCHQVC